MIGKRIGQYIVDAQIGAGGMGVVYRASDTRLKRLVAIKVFSDPAATPDASRRLLNEARSASALNHPNVCTIHEVGESEGQPFLVMELVEGRSLAAMIPEDGLPFASVIRYGAQIASALSHAHGRGVVHRDLKSLNVIVTPDGHVKVLDFGLARREVHMDPEAETVVDTLNTRGEREGIAGTMAYMAPEILRGEPADRRADIWALGVVLYEMAVGRLPFSGRTTFELCGQILWADPGPMSERVPPGLRTVVTQCLAKDPAIRYADAAEVRAALETMGTLGTSRSGTFSIAPAEQRKALLVLPFANLASDAESDYFADGLTEEVIADLSQVRQLRVISRTSSMQLKGTTKTVADLASQMRVSHVLEGSVRRSGTALRVTATLLDAASDSPVWSSKYTGALEDVFTIQETLSRAIVEALKVALTAEEEAQLKAHPIRDVRAFELYLRAKQEMLRFTRESLERAINYLELACTIEPDNAALLGSIGEAYWQHVNAGVSSDSSYLDKAEACARRAIELDPEAPGGHRVAGLARVHRGDLPGALAQLRQALARDANDPDSLMWGSLMAAMLGQMNVAKAWTAQLVAIDPVTPFFQLMPASMAWLSGDWARAAALFSERQTDLEGNPVMRFIYGHAQVAAGRRAEGYRQLEAAAAASPDNVFGQLSAVFRQALIGHRDDARAGLTPALIAALEVDPQYCWFLAECYALIGDVDEGLRWLEAAVTRGFLNHPMMAHLDPFLEALRGHARFPALMADVERSMRAVES